MKYLFSLAIFISISALPVLFVFAQATYEPIVSLPRLDANAQSTEQYVEALFFLSIAAAAILAFIKIIFGGVKWMLSDVVTDKSSARKDIWGAVFGLVIVLSAVLVLQTINPELVKLNFLQNAPSLDIQRSLQQQQSSTVERQIEFQQSCDGTLDRILADELQGTFQDICRHPDGTVSYFN